MTDTEKAKILDWLLTPVASRDDCDSRIDRTIHKDHLQALVVFRAWCSPDEALIALQKSMR